MENADEVAHNVYLFFKKYQDDLKKCFKNDDAITLTREATGIDRGKITKIIAKRNKRKLDFYGEDQESFVRNKVIKHYWKTNIMPTIDEMYTLLMKKYTISAPKKDVIKLLMKIGLKKNASEPQENIVIQTDKDTKNYVQNIQMYRKGNLPIYYLNETYYWGSRFREALFEGEIPSLIMVHAFGDAGFLDKKRIMVNYCSKAADEIMVHFENYDFMRETILPNISVPSVIVMNTQYSKYTDSILAGPTPDMNSTIVEMKNWLVSYGFSNSRDSNTCTKIDMFQRIGREVSKIEHSVGKITKESGHTVLCLPINGSGLDPVSLIWNDIKKVDVNSLQEWPYTKWNEYFKCAELAEEKCLNPSTEAVTETVAVCTDSNNDLSDVDLLRNDVDIDELL